MAIRKLRAGQQTYNADTYIGTYGTIFYDEDNGRMRISDGVTPGGQPLTLVSEDFAFTFGDFVATTETTSPFGASLSSSNTNQDINLVSNGSGSINVIGELNVYKPDTTVAGAMVIEPIFRVKNDGQIKMLVPGADTAEGAVGIVGGLDGVFQPPLNNGVMLHITGIAGTPGVPSRVYNDAQNAFAAFVARRYNNTAASPSAVLADEEIMRLSGTAHNGTSIPGTANQRIVYKALGNQTLTNQGGAIELWTTPLNSTTLTKVATVDNADGITSTKFTGPLTGNVTGNLTGTADVATTVTLVATNTTNAAHYLTFVDSATGNENVRTDTSLTYNPSTNILTITSGTISATTGTFTNFTGKYLRGLRDAGTISAGGTLTIDFSTDAVVYCVWGDGMTLNYQNFTSGSIVKILARKGTGTGVDTFSLGGLTAANTSTGSTTSSNVSADTTTFIELTCTGTTIGSVYAKL